MKLRSRGRGKQNIHATLCAGDVVSYRRKLISYHPQMEAHVIRAHDSRHWEKCWSSLWVYDFLVRLWIISEREKNKGKQVLSRVKFIITNLENVDRPLSSALTQNCKVFGLKKNENAKVYNLYERHCAILKLWFPHSRFDTKITFRRKVSKAQIIVRHLSKGYELSSVLARIHLMFPYLAKMTRDEMEGTVVTSLLPDDVISQVTMSLTDNDSERIYRANRRKWMTKIALKDEDQKEDNEVKLHEDTTVQLSGGGGKFPPKQQRCRRKSENEDLRMSHRN